MNQRYLILCVDDEREILDSVVQDLDCFEDDFVVEAAQSVSEAKEVLSDCQQQEIPLALILCDHIMPEQTGIQFLIELNADPQTAKARKILLTGQAGLDDTVKAINHAGLDFYISKPWQGDALRQTIKHQLTQYMIQNESDLSPWMKILDTAEILTALSQRRREFGE
ncbi:response regulator [Vibrio gazogenes]|uniref:Response regulator receiver domain-containing protein n=1 Tax=Vibrio gazogenes DSM 21264 = NBRC 103151 TaxID=1123492 RepID=A0A1M4YJD3_VIBGA|nr:response regulator [Vibrio gazogenes]USP15001.1 response regulator [Vibrio gazogenes]SHF05758.1 Response regulator receiver domain-containing protein [Vibrio gazogenes DSM 21264] [Vibrio gazogenes DSM 21264 = NBRC 103151]SJN56616.1 Hydrogenase transcriptional regulatory protein hupR1 [Vibrio gazogenes]